MLSASRRKRSGTFTMFSQFLWVGIGGFLGSIARYGASVAIRNWIPQPWPWATLLINITGCFAVGFFMTHFEKQSPNLAQLPLFICTGFIGGFTTFSAF